MSTFLRTARHLQTSQWWWRARYGLQRRRAVGSRDAARWRWQGSEPPRVANDFPEVPRFEEPEARDEEWIARLECGEFQHLNHTRELGHKLPDWRLGPVSSDRLWTVTLHYHAWAFVLAELAASDSPLADRAGVLFRHYIGDWMRRCSLDAPGARHLAWNAYAIATRIGWWIRAYRVLGRTRLQTWGGFEADLRHSLWQQANYLHEHLEWDLRANHLMRDAVGLAWAGRFFAESEAQVWLKTATRLARKQAREQVLHDGGHFERSPMYHLHVMEDVLTLSALIQDDAVRSELVTTWQRMAEYLLWVRHPDGHIPLLNDAAFNGTSGWEPMSQAARSLGVNVESTARRGGRYFADTGLVVCHGEPWTVFFDVGLVGPDYQPGHAHADSLTIDCSYRGRRLFVDPGTYGYDNDERRRYDRSTAAHNTVCIDHQDSSEVWHIFRVGRRAYPRDVSVDVANEALHAVGSHSGYDHLSGRPRHTRKVSVSDDGNLKVVDRVDGNGRHVVQGGYLVAPEWTATPTDQGWLLHNGEDALRVLVEGPDGLRLFQEPRPFHPEIGRELQTCRLMWQVDGTLPVEVRVEVERA